MIDQSQVLEKLNKTLIMLGSSEATWVCNLKKCWFTTVWNCDFFCFIDPHYFQILSGVSFILLFDQRSSRGTFGVKWGVWCKINVSLQIFSNLQKKIIFATTYKFQRALSRQNFEFLPWIKIISCFKKKIKT